jgi:hypothetical protein
VVFVGEFQCLRYHDFALQYHPCVVCAAVALLFLVLGGRLFVDTGFREDRLRGWLVRG